MTYLLSTVAVEPVERVIRDLAGTVVNQTVTRREHPSYGVTKGHVRSALDKMDGAIGLYMVMVGQANHPGVPALAEFVGPSTTDIVARARAAAQEVLAK